MASSSREEEGSTSGQGFDFPTIRVPNMMFQRMGNTQGLGILSEGIPSPFQMVEEGANLIGAGLPYSMNPGSAKNMTFFTKHLQAPCFPPKPPKIQPGEYETEMPEKNDVLMGRGSRINNHEGNIQFREHVNKYKAQYLDKNTKKVAKAHICANIVDWVRGLKPPGRFLQKSTDTGKWVEIGDERARKKAGQALREDVTATKKDGIDKKDSPESFISSVNSSGSMSSNGNSSNNLSAVGGSSLGASNMSSFASPDSFYTTTSSMATVPTSNTEVLSSTRSKLPFFYSATSQMQSSNEANLAFRGTMTESAATNGPTPSGSSEVFGLGQTHTANANTGNAGQSDSFLNNVDEEINHIEMDIKRMNAQLHKQQLYLKQQQSLTQQTQQQQYFQQQQQYLQEQQKQQQQKQQQQQPYLQQQQQQRGQQEHKQQTYFLQQQQPYVQQQQQQQYIQQQQQQPYIQQQQQQPYIQQQQRPLPQQHQEQEKEEELGFDIEPIPVNLTVPTSVNSPQSVVENRNNSYNSAGSEIQDTSSLAPPQLSHCTTEEENAMLSGSVMSWNNGGISSSMLKRSSIASRGRRSSMASNSIRRSMTIHRSRVGRAHAESFNMNEMMMSITSLEEDYDPTWLDVENNGMQMSFIGSIGEVELDDEDLNEFSQ